MNPSLRRLVFALLCVALLSLGAQSQDAPVWKLSAVTDPMGQDFLIPADVRDAGPGVESFDSPYLLLNKTNGLALWYVNGGRAFPVVFEGGKVPPGKAAPQVVGSGGQWFLVYVVDGGNEFWKLDAETATPVKSADGTLFSQRSRITRGGDKAILYQGSYTGKTDLFEISGSTAKPVKITDKADHGTAQYAWRVDGKLLVAFYMGGTHDFYWLEDGEFKPCWERNGSKDDASQIESIHDARWNGRLFLNLVRRDGKAEIWTLRKGELSNISNIAAAWYKPGLAAPGRDGLYFVGDGALAVTDGTEARNVTADGKAIVADSKVTLVGHGGGVLLTSRDYNSFTSWLISGGVHKLGTHKVDTVATYVLAASLGDEDLVRCTDESGKQSWKLFKAGNGQEVALGGTPEDFGKIEFAWSVQADGKTTNYAVERKADTTKFRLWELVQ